MKIVTLAFVSLIAPTSGAFVWGASGHSIIAEIAQHMRRGCEAVTPFERALFGERSVDLKMHETGGLASASANGGELSK